MTRTFASIGECMVELSPAGDGLYRRGFAGDTFNTAWHVRALAAPSALAVRYVSAVGDDALSGELVGFIGAAGIATDHVAVVPGRAVGLYLITLTGHERSFTYWRDTSAARLLAADPDRLAAALADVDCAYLSGITLAILSEAHRVVLFDALAAVRARGAMVAFDPNLRPRLWPGREAMRAGIEAGYRAATVALPTFDDDRALFGDEDPAATAARIAGYGVAEVVVKNGAEPCLVAVGGRRTAVPGIRVDHPVDTTGAGDSFGAGYLAGRLRGLAPVEAAGLGHQVAARVITVRGGLAPMALFDDLRA